MFVKATFVNQANSLTQSQPHCTRIPFLMRHLIPVYTGTRSRSLIRSCVPSNAVSGTMSFHGFILFMNPDPPSSTYTPTIWSFWPPLIPTAAMDSSDDISEQFAHSLCVRWFSSGKWGKPDVNVANVIVGPVHWWVAMKFIAVRTPHTLLQIFAGYLNWALLGILCTQTCKSHARRFPHRPAAFPSWPPVPSGLLHSVPQGPTFGEDPGLQCVTFRDDTDCCGLAWHLYCARIALVGNKPSEIEHDPKPLVQHLRFWRNK